MTSAAGVSTEPLPAAPGASSRQTWLLRPLVLPAVLTVLCLPVGTLVPEARLDASWRLAMSWSHQLGVQAGSEWVFTYGPLSFLTTPNLVWWTGAAFGLLYAIAVTFSLLALAHLWLREWLRPWVAVVALAGLAVSLCALAQLPPLPEMAVAAIVLAALRLVRPRVLNDLLPARFVVLLSAAASLQLLVKFSTGIVALAVCGVVAVSRPNRLTNVVAAALSALGTLILLWLAAGQDLGDLPRWLRLASDVALGYSSAMSSGAFVGGSRYWLAVLVPTLAFAVVLVRWIRDDGWRSIPSVAIASIGVWFFLKAGYVRLDPIHAPLAFVGFASLCAAMPWRRRAVGLAVLAWSAVVIAIVGVASPLSTNGFDAAMPGDPARAVFVDHPQNVGSLLRALVDSSYRSGELSDARVETRREYAVPPRVVSALNGRRVHAEQADIVALWANRLSWQPELALQSYSTYTPFLDRENRDHLGGSHAPQGVLFRSRAIDGKVPFWESPSYQVGLVCRYRVVADGGEWKALHRTADSCGNRIPLGEARAGSGDVVTVPEPSSPSSIVVATFNYVTPPVERAMTALLKPTETPRVQLDGDEWRFVPGTARQDHLLRVPDDAASGDPLYGGLNVRRLSFPDASGTVTVRFFEIPA